MLIADTCIIHDLMIPLLFVFCDLGQISPFPAVELVYAALQNLHGVENGTIFHENGTFVVAYVDRKHPLHVGSELRYQREVRRLVYIVAAQKFFKNPIKHVAVSLWQWKNGCIQKVSKRPYTERGAIENSDIRSDIVSIYHRGHNVIWSHHIEWGRPPKSEHMLCNAGGHRMQFNRSTSGKVFTEPTQSLVAWRMV